MLAHCQRSPPDASVQSPPRAQREQCGGRRELRVDGRLSNGLIRPLPPVYYVSGAIRQHHGNVGVGLFLATSITTTSTGALCDYLAMGESRSVSYHWVTSTGTSTWPAIEANSSWTLRKDVDSEEASRFAWEKAQRWRGKCALLHRVPRNVFLLMTCKQAVGTPAVVGFQTVVVSCGAVSRATRVSLPGDRRVRFLLHKPVPSLENFESRTSGCTITHTTQWQLLGGLDGV